MLSFDDSICSSSPSSIPNNMKASGLIDIETRYDVRKYVAILILAGANILNLFGYTEEGLKDEIAYGEKQTVLKPAAKADPKEK